LSALKVLPLSMTRENSKREGLKMQFTLTIDGMGNAAFTESEYGGAEVEISRILRDAADRIESGHMDAGRLVDLNGNCVGFYRTSD
jgi:hypothetical protein